MAGGREHEILKLCDSCVPDSRPKARGARPHNFRKVRKFLTLETGGVC